MLQEKYAELIERLKENETCKQNQVLEFESERSTLETRINELETQNEILSQKIDAMNIESENVKEKRLEERSLMINEIKETESVLEELKIGNDTLKREKDIKEKEFWDLKETYEVMVKEFDGFKAMKIESENKNAELQAENEMKINQMKKENSTLKETQKMNMKEISELTLQKDNLAIGIQNMENQNQELEAEIEKLMTEQTQNQNEILELKENKGDMIRRFDECMCKYETLSSELEETMKLLESSHEENIGKLHEMETENERMKSKMKEQVERMTQLVDQNETMVNMIDNIKVDHEGQMQKVIDDLDSERGKCKDLESQLSEKNGII